MEEPMKTSKIPQTDSIQELARFWDSHDLTDFKDQLEEVTDAIFERIPDSVMTIHLQPKELEAVRRIAKSKGVDQSALLREWVIEKLHSS